MCWPFQNKLNTVTAIHKHIHKWIFHTLTRTIPYISLFVTEKYAEEKYITVQEDI